MKWLVVLLILILVICLIAFRYRQQILMGLQLWRMYKSMKNPRGGEVSDKKSQSKGDLKDTPLARCEKCGQWSPADGMLKIGSNKYCSTQCMEKAARLKSLVDN